MESGTGTWALPAAVQQSYSAVQRIHLGILLIEDLKVVLRSALCPRKQEIKQDLNAEKPHV